LTDLTRRRLWRFKVENAASGTTETRYEQSGF
jgi:hypothetical protein